MLDADTKEKVRKQVEFYFSDSNLPRDNFLKEKVAEDKDGFVDIAILCIFSRMSQLLKSSNKEVAKVPAEQVAGVAEALEGSSVLTLSQDKKRVRRTEALRPPEEVAREVDERSLYAAPFPFDATLDALTGYFGKAGAVNCVRMRRHLTSKDFKGSVFVEFATKEEADKVAAMQLEYEGAPVSLEPKLQYIQRKADERHAQPNSPHQKGKGTEQAGEAAAAAGEGAAEGEGGAEGGEEGEAEEAAAVPEFTPGCVLHFDFGDEEITDDVKFGTIKDSFGGRNGGVGFVDYQQGDTSGHVRFNAPEQAQEVVGKLEEGGTMLVAGVKATVHLVEGEEETQYMIRANKAREAKKAAGGGRGGRGGGRGRGGRGGGRGFRGGGRGRGGGGGGRGRGQKRQRDD